MSLTYLILPLWLLLTGFFQELWHSFTRIATINSHLQTAHTAYKKRDYKTAAFEYGLLVDSLNADDPRMTLMCGHAWYFAGSKRNAYRYYARLVNHPNKSLRSVAWQQLGFMYAKQPAKGLAYFRKALQANPDNGVARYNYELLKLLHPNADKPRRPQPQLTMQQVGNKADKASRNNQGGDNKGQGQQSGNGVPQQDGDGKGQGNNRPPDAQTRKEIDQKQDDKADKSKSDKSNKPNGDKNGKQEAPDQRNPDVLQANKADLDRLKMSAEQAKAVLDAMKSNEVQYLQQRKYPKNGKTKPDKPIW